MARRKKKRPKKTAAPTARPASSPAASGRAAAAPPGERPRRPLSAWLPRPAIAALPIFAAVLALTVAFSLHYFWNEDFWWYLSSGEAILDGGEIPDGDPFLYPQENRGRWITHSWLWTVLVAALYRVFGLGGDVVFGALLGIAFVTLIFTHRSLDRFGLLNGLAAAAALWTINHRLAVKAELASWLLALVFFCYLERSSRFTWRSAVLMAALQWLWSNLHGGYPLGIAVVVAYSVGGWLEARRSGEEQGRLAYPPLWFGPALVAVSLATPGLAVERLRILGALLKIRSDAVAGLPPTGVIEWQSTFAGEGDLYSAMYVVFLIVGLLSFPVSRGRLKGARFLLFCAMALLGLAAVRMVPGFVALSSAIAIANLAQLRPALRRRCTPTRPLPKTLYALGCGLFCLMLLATAAGVRIAQADFEVDQSADSFFSLSPLSTCPGAADYVLQQDLPGPIFNEMIIGGYLTHRLFPRHQLFIDNRNLSAELLRHSREMMSSPVHWRAGEKRFGFRTVILPNIGTRIALRQYLASDPQWRMVYLDPLAVVFVRGNAAAPQLRVRSLSAGEEAVPFLAAGSAWYLRALRRLAYPLLRYDAFAFLTDYLSVLGELRQPGAVAELADATLREGLVETTQAAGILWFRGMARLSMGQQQAARGDLEEAIRYGTNEVEARITYATILERLGDRKAALDQLEEAARLDPANPQIRKLRRRLVR